MRYSNLNRHYFTKIILFFLLIILSLSEVHAQQQRTCGVMEYMEKKLGDSKPSRPIAPTQEGHSRSALPIITIPTVVHIVYNDATQNISDAQILSQIQVLNDDFRRRNLDAINTPAEFLAVAADIEIEFCLANVDPNGFETTGITRTSTSTDFFGLTDEIKSRATGGQSPWNTTDYLNIWVGSLGGGLLGYAQFPGANPLTDGVVVDYQYFGTIGTATAPFDLGRTTTHEVGHWLDLRHIWGDGGCTVDDGVSDTPLAGGPNYSSIPCTHPGTNSCVEASGDLPDMFQNFMDYSDDACMNLFTIGQRDRMRALFEPTGDRVSLLSSQGCANNGIIPTCSDNTMNGTETGIDCGGATCIDCSTFCNDGILNGDETALDCGGSCEACPPDSGQTCEVAIAISNSGVYTALGPSIGMGANNTPATHANWYEFVAMANGTIDLMTCGEGVDTRLWIYEGCCDNLISVANADDECELSPGGNPWATQLTGIAVTKGKRYFIEWDDRWSTDGFDFTFTFTPFSRCTDGIMNGDETGIDCGGLSCKPCQASLVLDNIICHDNETLTDSSDDYITFDLNPIGIMGTNYTIMAGRANIVPTGGTYGMPTSFQTASGSAGLGDLTLIISDNTNCTSSIILPDPGSCSTAVIPTLSQWGLLLYGLLILNMGVLLIGTSITRMD